MTRNVYRPDGNDADLSKARQTDLFVVVIKGTRTDASQSAQTLVVDLLPAGFEIETATVSKGRSTTDYSWLPELTEATYTEQRDDRFVAALDLKDGDQGFHPRLCRPRRYPRRIQIPRPRRRGHVRARNHRAHRDRQADCRCPVSPSSNRPHLHPLPACGGGEGPRAATGGCGESCVREARPVPDPLRPRGWSGTSALPCLLGMQSSLLTSTAVYSTAVTAPRARPRRLGSRPRRRRVDPARLSDRGRQMAAAGRARQGRSALSPHADRRRGRAFSMAPRRRSDRRAARIRPVRDRTAMSSRAHRP